jgi:serine/threonine protein kinase
LDHYGFRCGTPGYMAPEVIEDRLFSNKSDIFSLGAILYNMVTGKQIFRSKLKFKVIEKTLECDADRYCS